MSKVSDPGTAVTSAISVEAVRAQVQKVLASKRFATSERHCRLLRYLLEQTLAGSAGQLKEYILGVEVFGRGESFNTQSDPIVRTELSRLRGKLKGYYESDGRYDDIVIDLPPRSYSLSFDVQPAPNRAVKANVHAASRSGRLLVAAILPIVALAGLWALMPRGTASAKAGGTSLAVLPFANLSGDPETERFGDGLAEELIHYLAEVDGLRVVSRTSVFHFKGRQEDLRTIAAQLDVNMVVEGAVRKTGDRIRINTRLVNAADGRQLRSYVSEHDPRDVHNVQQQIAHQLISALQLHRIGRAQESATRRFTNSAEAYRLYLEGRYHANKRTETDLRKAIDCYERAILADRDYSPAHASLADAEILLTLLNEARPREAMEKAKQAARRAVKTGEALSEAHIALGSVLALYELDWPAAEKEFRKAVELDPNDSNVREAFAMRYLAPRGQLDLALMEMRHAERLDPFSPEVGVAVGRIEYFKRNADPSISSFEKILDLDPSAPLALAAAYVQKSLLEQALRTLQEASTPTEDEARLAALGQVYALTGQPARARHVLGELAEVARQRYVSGYYFALVHLALGERAQALTWLEKAAEERCPLIVYLQVDPQFDGLRQEPRFRTLVHKLRLGDDADLIVPRS